MAEQVKPVCGWCGHIIEGECNFDPRGLGPEGEQRVCHPACVAPFRAALEKQHRQALSDVLRACVRVRNAYYDYGPVDDGRPEGKEFEAALDSLISAAIGAGVKMTTGRHKRKKHAKKAKGG